MCCSDHQHCCPQHTTCDVEHQKCTSVSDSLEISWDDIKRPNVLPQKLAAIKCDDGTECPWGSTCCVLQSGKYGCCPMAKVSILGGRAKRCTQICSICHQTCSAMKCVRYALYTKGKGLDGKSYTGGKHNALYSLKVLIPVNLLFCAVEEMTKPTLKKDINNLKFIMGHRMSLANSARKTADGFEVSFVTLVWLLSTAISFLFWIQATCCADHIHCCPEGYKCNVATAQCSKESSSLTVPLTLHSRSHAHLPAERSDITCPDHKTQCPDGMTCCKMQSGVFGCCPLKNVRMADLSRAIVMSGKEKLGHSGQKLVHTPKTQHGLVAMFSCPPKTNQTKVDLFVTETAGKDVANGYQMYGSSPLMYFFAILVL